MYNVVVVDDEKLICDAIRSVLETSIPEISQILVFQDGQEAFDYLSGHHADILMLDVRVPGRTGLEIASMVRSQNADSYIFIITAYRDFEYAHQAIRCSVNDFLTKPFSSRQLIAAVQNAVSRFRERDSSKEAHRRDDRNLLLSLCRAQTLPDGCGDIRFCGKTVPLSRLKCTEVTLTDLGFDAVPAQLLPTIGEKLTCAAEDDTEAQTSLLIEQTPERIQVLVLSRDAPNLSFVSELVGAISAQSGGAPVRADRTFASFVRYHEQLSFERELDFFFDLVIDGSVRQAKKYLTKRILSLSPEQTQAFSEFLLRDHQVRTAPDPESVIQGLDQLVQSYLHKDTGNYIVESAKEYMQRHFAVSALSLKSVADALFVSSAYLSRLFKKHNDVNFTDYLLKLRMEHARQLLLTTHQPTVAIAAAVGYENVSYFRLSFKSYFGMTPSQYRQFQNNRKDGEGS